MVRGATGRLRRSESAERAAAERPSVLRRYEPFIRSVASPGSNVRREYAVTRLPLLDQLHFFAS